MNWLRKKVSGKRNRHKCDKFELDITYITERILAMSFPASGFESMYRNNIADVAKFLDEKHAGHHRIFNLSNREYSTEKFNADVKSYPWEDHHSPAIETLFEICRDMYEYLSGKPDQNKTFRKYR